MAAPELRACLGTAALNLALLSCGGLNLFALPYGLASENSEGAPCLARFVIVLKAATAVSVGSLAVWMAAVATSQHLRAVAGYIVWNWAQAVLAVYEDLTRCSPSLTPQAQVTVDGWLSALRTAIAVAVALSGFDLAISRVEAVEATSLRSFGSRRLRPLLRMQRAAVLPITACYLLGFAYGLQGAVYIFLALMLLITLIAFLLIGLLCRSLCRILGLATLAAATAPPWLGQRAQSVPRNLRTEMLCLAASWLSSLLYMAAGLISAGADEEGIFPHLLASMDMFCNSLLGLVLSGALSGAVQGTNRRALLAKQRRRSRKQAVAHGRRSDGTAGFQAWDKKVEELAGRAVSLSALLRFYRALPKSMPHYCAAQHTTADVVRQSIIPLTSAQRCSAAEMLMSGVHTRPDKMVTHAWSSLFRDLVAAVVADALHEGEYALFSRLLNTEGPELEDWVQRAGVGGRTYWICATAVNQHRGICESNGEKQDSVTGMPCPPCNCGLPKAWNSSAPVLPDGRSVPCEMNKFDHLMRFLAAANPSFSQVVCIDAQFRTFTRAWCIAELATAKDLGMVQDIKIRSSSELEKHEESLRNLRIQDMRASRPEDKAAILASIADHSAFNLSIQRLIFEDLLPSWSSLDATERMACAGQFIRWHETSAWASNCPEQELCWGEATIGYSVSSPGSTKGNTVAV